MKKRLFGVLVFLLASAPGFGSRIFAHEAVDFEGTIQIVGLNEKITEKVSGSVAVTQWGHGVDTGGNFEEAIFTYTFGTQTTGCGDVLDEESVRVSAYREDEYSVTTKKFPMDFSEDGMASVIERILIKYASMVQDTLGWDECFTMSDGTGTTESGKSFSFANACVTGGKAVITSSSVKISFSIKPRLKTYGGGSTNKTEYPLKVSGKLEIPIETEHQH